MTKPRRWRYAMVGGGRGAFIGAVHRHAMALDGRYELVAGALSASADTALASARELGIADARSHGDWRALIADEAGRAPGDRVDLIVIVAPNDAHHAIAAAAIDAGFAVACDKPLVHTSTQAEDLAARVGTRDTPFAVTYNYTGYPLVRQMRAMVAAGTIGDVRKVVVEYHQGWLATALENGSGANRQARWRTDPSRAGIAGAVADIGSHAENLVATVTGLEVESLCADLTHFVPGRRLDDDASVLLRFTSGARGVLVASQIAVGCENDLHLRVFGERGTLDWRQEQPDQLWHRRDEGPPMLWTRNAPGLCAAALRACRLPPGHPEGFIEAFANLYQGLADDLDARARTGIPAPASVADYPRIDAGVRGVRFIEATVASGASDAKWTPIGARPPPHR